MHCIQRVTLGLTIIQSFTVRKVASLKSKFFSRARGPSASTPRHFWKTSQYPLKLSHGAPSMKKTMAAWGQKHRMNCRKLGAICMISNLASVWYCLSHIDLIFPRASHSLSSPRLFYHQCLHIHPYLDLWRNNTSETTCPLILLFRQKGRCAYFYMLHNTWSLYQKTYHPQGLWCNTAPSLDWLHR